MTNHTESPLALKTDFEDILERILKEPDRDTARQGPISDAVQLACNGPFVATVMVFVFATEIARSLRALTAETTREHPDYCFGVQVPDGEEPQPGVLTANRVIAALTNGEKLTAAMTSAAYLNTEQDPEQLSGYLAWFPILAWELAHNPDFKLAQRPAGGDAE